MGPWSFRELIEPADILEAAEDVAVWGFPRPIDESELIHGSWFRMGKGVIWWYEAPTHGEQTSAFMHFATAPRFAKRWPIRRWFGAVQVVAELMGAERLIFSPTEGDDRIADYALRLGWETDALGRFVFPLGGGASWGSCRRRESLA